MRMRVSSGLARSGACSRLSKLLWLLVAVQSVVALADVIQTAAPADPQPVTSQSSSETASSGHSAVHPKTDHEVPPVGTVSEPHVDEATQFVFDEHGKLVSGNMEEYQLANQVEEDVDGETQAVPDHYQDTGIPPILTSFGDFIAADNEHSEISTDEVVRPDVAQKMELLRDAILVKRSRLLEAWVQENSTQARLLNQDIAGLFTRLMELRRKIGANRSALTGPNEHQKKRAPPGPPLRAAPLTDDVTWVKVRDMPRVWTIPDFLSAEECDKLINESLPLLKPCTGRSCMEVPDTLHSVTAKAFSKRVAGILWPSRATEDGVQVVRYRKGDQFGQHNDRNDDSYDIAATVMVWLNDLQDDQGGGTFFPRAKPPLHVRPKKGTALVWYSCLPNGRIDERAQHVGQPVHKGEKWIANVFLYSYSTDLVCAGSPAPGNETQ